MQAPPKKSKTVTITIQSEPKKVYDFVSDPTHLPLWAKTFCRSVKQTDGEWVIDTPQGPTKIRLADKNDFGVLDHYLEPPAGGVVFVPMRVLPNGGGSEVVFTVFQLPGATDESYEKDVRLVEQDLKNLKKYLEG
ncbi:MAG: SRPBCC family protein [Candidatus Omnitrophota bacterium]